MTGGCLTPSYEYFRIALEEQTTESKIDCTFEIE
jgi:hypothetical protein